MAVWWAASLRVCVVAFAGAAEPNWGATATPVTARPAAARPRVAREKNLLMRNAFARKIGMPSMEHTPALARIISEDELVGADRPSDAREVVSLVSRD